MASCLSNSAAAKQSLLCRLAVPRGSSTVADFDHRSRFLLAGTDPIVLPLEEEGSAAAGLHSAWVAVLQWSSSSSITRCPLFPLSLLKWRNLERTRVARFLSLCIIVSMRRGSRRHLAMVEELLHHKTPHPHPPRPCLPSSGRGSAWWQHSLISTSWQKEAHNDQTLLENGSLSVLSKMLEYLASYCAPCFFLLIFLVTFVSV